MRPPRLRCTLFSLIYPPHLLGSYKRQLYGFVLFSRLTKRNLASYVISVRRTKSSLTASFRFYLTIDTLAVQLYTSLSPRRVRDFHPLERAHGAQTKNKAYIFHAAFRYAPAARSNPKPSHRQDTSCPRTPCGSASICRVQTLQGNPHNAILRSSR